MKSAYRTRRLVVLGIAFIGFAFMLLRHPDLQQPIMPEPAMPSTPAMQSDAARALDALPVKGRAPKTDYARTQFGSGWSGQNGCDTRNIILKRDLVGTVVNERCQIVSGVLNDPYTGNVVQFQRGELSSQAVQIDHVVALSNAWQTGAQSLSLDERILLANDPLELLAVDGASNQQKSDGDAATWLPANKAFRCQYVARQIAVKTKYRLWVTPPEKAAMLGILKQCPGQALPAA